MNEVQGEYSERVHVFVCVHVLMESVENWPLKE